MKTFCHHVKIYTNYNLKRENISNSNQNRTEPFKFFGAHKMPNQKLKFVVENGGGIGYWYEDGRHQRHLSILRFFVHEMPFVLWQDMCSKVSHMWLDFFTWISTRPGFIQQSTVQHSIHPSCRFGSLIAWHL